MRPRRRTTTYRTSRYRKPKSSDSLAVVWVDGKDAREKIRGDYEKAQASLAKGRTQLERHLREDVPAYQQWFHHTFGSLLTDIREAGQKLEEARLLIMEIEFEAMTRMTTLPEAYRRVIHRRKHPEACSEEDTPFEFDPEDPGEAPEAEEFREAFGFNGTNHQASEEPGKHHRPAPRNESSNKKSARLKDIYRRLVRLLHPDGQTEMTAEKLERWHQTQEAYLNEDLEQMEILLALCELDESGQTNKTSLSLLQRITRQFRRALREINRQLKQLRQNPAWNFTRRRDRKRLERETRIELEMTHDELVYQLEQFEDLLAEWRQ